MADLDSKLSTFGESLREAVHRPHIDDVIDRGRRRITRRNLQVAVVAVVAVIAVAIPSLRTRATSEPAVRPDVIRSTPVVAMDFFNADHGFALWVQCPGEGHHPGEICTRQLSSTEDGKVWKNTTVPRSVPGDYASVQALGPRSALVEISRATTTRYFTADAGQSWQEVSRLPQSGTVSQIPDRATLEIKCEGVATPGPDCVHNPITVVLPDTGQVATLTTQPPFQATHGQRFADAAGTWWVSGIDVATGNTMLGRSTDRGRSWQVSPLPWVTLTNGVQVSVYGNGITHYLIVTKQQEVTDIRRSTDGGRTWQPVDGQWPAGIEGVAEVHPDGALVLRASGRSYISHDGGRSFDGPTDLVWLPPLSTRAGVLSVQQDQETGAFRYRLSDGTRLIGGEIPRP
jgi:photosystem II stability/assembly factor-like uncharacterized protein